MSFYLRRSSFELEDAQTRDWPKITRRSVLVDRRLTPIGRCQANDVGCLLGRSILARKFILDGISSSRTFQVNAKGVGRPVQLGFSATNLFSRHLVFPRLFHDVLESDRHPRSFPRGLPQLLRNITDQF